MSVCPSCGAPLPAGATVCPNCSPAAAGETVDGEPTRIAHASVLHHPLRIGPYRILAVLGEGGMGVVYHAEQEHPIRRRVAIKVIKIGMDTRDVVARFESERQALAMMDHPNIARVHDAGANDDGRPYFVMEYVAGVPITDYCDRHRVSTRARLELFVQVCGAIQHAHQKGVIHRDIKPSNILVTVQNGRPHPKVIDFGVAKATHQKLTEKTVYTQQGVLIGTPAYMSPEQAEMGGLSIDTTTDIYSLGVLLYELLIGALPFDPARLRAAGYAEMQRIIREEDPLRPSTRLSGLTGSATDVAKRRDTDFGSLRRELTGDLDWITLKAMEKDRTRRYASASELAADVERHLTHDPVVARPASVAYRTRKFIRKHRAAVGAGLVAISTLIAAFIVSAVMYVRSETARQMAERQAYMAAIAAADAQILAANSVPGYRRSGAMEAERRLSETPRRHRNWEWHYLVAKLDESVKTFWGTTDPDSAGSIGNPTDVDTFRLVGTPQYQGQLAIDANRQELLWHTSAGVHAWDLKTARFAGAWSGHGVVFAISDDGDKILSANWRLNAPWRVTASKTGTVVSALQADLPAVKVAWFSRDGRRLATAGGDGSVHVWDTASGARIASTQVSGSAVAMRFVENGRLMVATETELHSWPFGAGNGVTEVIATIAGKIVAFDVTADGRRAVIGDGAGDIHSWREPSSGSLGSQLQDKLALVNPTRSPANALASRPIGRHAGITVVALSGDGRVVATGGQDSVVRLWDGPALRQIDVLGVSGPAVLDAHDALPIDALRFDQDDAHLLVGSRRGVVRMWDVRRARRATGMRSGPFRMPFGRAEALSPNGQYAVSSDARLNVAIVDISTLETSSIKPGIGGPRNRIRAVAVTADGSRAVFGNEDGSVDLWNRGDSNAPVTIAKEPGAVTAVALDKNGETIAAAWFSVAGGRVPETGVRGQLRVWQISPPREILRAETMAVGSLVFGATAETLLVAPVPVRRDGPGSLAAALEGAYDRPECADPVNLWDLSRALIVVTIPTCPATLAFTGSRIATYSADEVIRVWDGRDGSLVSTSHQVERVSRLAISADGSRVAARMPNKLGIYASDTAALLLTMVRQGNSIDSTGAIAFGLAGRLVNLDSSVVTVWDAAVSYDPEARSIARRAIAQPAKLADELIEEIRATPNIDSLAKEAAIAEVRQIGDRDLKALCDASRAIVLRSNASAPEYQRALRMSSSVAQRAPWSAACVGTLAMAKYRLGDHAGALESLKVAVSERANLLDVELAFKAMAHYQLGQLREARDAAASFGSTSLKTADATTLTSLTRELEGLAARHPAQK